MTCRVAFIALLTGFWALSPAAAQEQSGWEIESLGGEGGVVFDLSTGLATATNGVVVRYEQGVLSAQRVTVNQSTGEVAAEGKVRIQRDDQVWVSDSVVYNFKTRRFEARQFRTGKWPVFAEGEGLGIELNRMSLVKKLLPKDTPVGLGSIIGAAHEHIRTEDKAAAQRASLSARLDPAMANQALIAPTADLNTNGFVTVDEVLAIKQSGANDQQLLDKLEATGQVFEISPEMVTFLWTRGIDKTTIDVIPQLNPGAIAQFRPDKPGAQMAGMPAEAAAYVYTATNAIITADDIAEPLLKIRARKIKIQPGQRIQATDAVLYAGDVPVFYFPYYTRKLDKFANHFNFAPGFRSSYGAFLLSSYNWFWDDRLDGSLHLDYRTKRGAGLGPDINYHLGEWGAGSFRYYYMHDESPDEDVHGANNPENRQRVHFTYLANPSTNISIRSMVRWQGDTNIVREFFESEYRDNPQPSTFVEVNKFWQNFSLDFYAQPRLNDWLQTVERLPEVRLTGYRQELGDTPVYYESESSLGYYRQRFPEISGDTLGLNYDAGRGDTYHQLTSPQIFFGWLRFTPRAGGRYTYYTESDGPGGQTDEEHRGVFNTGAELSFKASRLWPKVQNTLFDLDGLRHIVEPSLNYVYVPSPSVRPKDLPQFDREWPSFHLLPIEYPDYRAIDSIDAQNVVRLGLRNRLQTKREGRVESFLNWELFTDWRLDPRTDQTRFADVYSEIEMKPRDWLRLESITRYDVEGGGFRMSYNMATFEPNNVWSWGVGHLYLEDDFSADPTALGQGNNLLLSTIYYRLSENWGFRFHHRYDLIRNRMEEQAYTIYRDLRSWTAGLTLRLRDNPQGPEDVSVAFTFSIKAFPRYSLGNNDLRNYSFWSR